MKLRYRYWTRAAGTGGQLREPQDFSVREVIDRRFLAAFLRGRRVEKMHGSYVLCLLKKEDMTTERAVAAAARALRINERAITYAGLKDRHAVTEQYVTVNSARDIEPVHHRAFQLLPLRRINRPLAPGDLLANEFEITLHQCKTHNTAAAIAELEQRGMPNYFGMQRFGSSENNHVIGRLLVRRRFGDALRLVNAAYDSNYHSLQRVEKKRLKFFVHAYQSWLFNECLTAYLRAHDKPLYRLVPVAGAGTRLGSSVFDRLLRALLKKQGIDLSALAIPELSLSCSGSRRPAFIKAGQIQYEIMGTTLRLRFALPKGSYATVLLREITKSSPVSGS